MVVSDPKRDVLYLSSSHLASWKGHWSNSGGQDMFEHQRVTHIAVILWQKYEATAI